ncbi:DEAD/DEAH box helicase family protein [Tumebacillus permanentifrigoris]|uniref:Type III restriction enzyme n=1 Tax=Tumebacillus permanentifrigoris TaxID=378543 RepID=A0A316D9T7_9BACL|nr:DEAD/DEAH box helicase family protein [Tumebacillus permanentifrigoris]PWK13108.1 type III restriction enzyme [Tumebacillus permanentifrigoris]
MELKPFQMQAAEQMATRCLHYFKAPLYKRDQTTLVPFYQGLSAITGAGKTPILADVIERIRLGFPADESPIMLWISKSKAVVWQTYCNFESGKYADLVRGFTCKPLLDCKQEDIEEQERGLLLMATVGKFNHKDKEAGERKVFQANLDQADHSLWELLKRRTNAAGTRRPLIVVYDEGHNLSNQQTELLFELQPHALLVASATFRVPEALKYTMDRLKLDLGWTQEHLVTSVRSSDVVEAGLVKRSVLLGGYLEPMEVAVTEMVAELRKVEEIGKRVRLRPKAIYVCNTNLTDDGKQDDISKPFADRLARPILIWRHLVENCGIHPHDIAVYCNLKFSKSAPPPPDFHLFSGGDADYEAFTSGAYRHIIFNLSLQEGWDDPDCYFAYFDKCMGSKDQITQVLGRVLRQPGATHPPEAALTTAQLFLRADDKQVMRTVIEEVSAELAVELPDVELKILQDRTQRANRRSLAPKKLRFLPVLGRNQEQAQQEIQRIMGTLNDYRNDVVNTEGKSKRIKKQQRIGSGAGETWVWVDGGPSRKVRAGWLLKRELRKYSKALEALCPVDARLDAKVGSESVAEHYLLEIANKIVTAYYQRVTILQNVAAPLRVGEVTVDASQLYTFKNALHEGYDDLNSFEKAVADALDDLGYDWMRNPSKGGYMIPLVEFGAHQNFCPDFLVWTDDGVVAIDPKGDHLIQEDALIKLFDIPSLQPGPELKVRLITRGEWSAASRKSQSPHGFTVWTQKEGRVHTVTCESLEVALNTCLQTSTA